MNFSDAGKPAVRKAEPPAGPARVLMVCPASTLPEPLDTLLRRKDAQFSWVPSYETAERHHLADQFDLALFFPGKITDIDQKRRLGRVLVLTRQKNIPILLLTEDATLINMLPGDTDTGLSRVQTARPEIGPEELWGRVCAMLDFAPLFSRIEEYTGRLEQWAFALNNRFEELHQELRLAWRVQQDFLPKRLPCHPRLRFGTLYRPASWVSGDIYDIFPLDEHHVGLSIADVVGHGVAAGLMTLFVKRALVTKEITAAGYRLLSPDQALARLNDELCSLELPEHQFVTACYGVLNLDTLELSFARAGHPHPILIDPQGRWTRIGMEGSLLGVFPGAAFPRTQLTLAPGSKLILYTDGLEQAFDPDGDEGRLLDQIAELATLPADQMTDALAAKLDCQENSLHPADDITAVVLEILP